MLLSDTYRRSCQISFSCGGCGVFFWLCVVFFWLSALVQSLWFWLVPDRSSWIVGGGPISVVRWLVEWVLDVGWGGCLAGACGRGDHAFFLF